MGKNRNKKPLPPRRKRMNRKRRLQAAKTWLPAFQGKNMVRGYARWFGVDRLCAVAELRMLGIAIDQRYVEQLQRTEEAKRQRRKAERAEFRAIDDRADQDETFAFIAGYTSGGAPFGVKHNCS